MSNNDFINPYELGHASDCQCRECIDYHFWQYFGRELEKIQQAQKQAEERSAQTSEEAKGN